MSAGNDVIFNISLGDLAHRLQRESGYNSRQGTLLTLAIAPNEQLNGRFADTQGGVDLPGYRRVTGAICRNDIAYLRLSPLSCATAKIVWTNDVKKLRAILPITEEPIGHIGNLFMECKLPEPIKTASHCRRVIEHACGPLPLDIESSSIDAMIHWLDNVGTMLGIPIIWYRLDGSLMATVGPVSTTDDLNLPMRVLFHHGRWYKIERL